MRLPGDLFLWRPVAPAQHRGAVHGRAESSRFGPARSGFGSSLAGASALKRRAQHGHVPPCSATRVTSGSIVGISARSQTSQGLCSAPDTSAPQAWQESARTSWWRVGLGWSKAMGAGMGLGLALGNRGQRRLVPLGRRQARIVRRLGRQAELGFQPRDPRRQTRILGHQGGIPDHQRPDPLQQRDEIRASLSVGSAGAFTPPLIHRPAPPSSRKCDLGFHPGATRPARVPEQSLARYHVR